MNIKNNDLSQILSENDEIFCSAESKKRINISFYFIFTACQLKILSSFQST